jgi:hypothetical protein
MSTTVDSRFARLDLNDSPTAPTQTPSRASVEAVSSLVGFGAETDLKRAAGRPSRDKRGVWHNLPEGEAVTAANDAATHRGVTGWASRCIRLPQLLEALDADQATKHDVDTPEALVRLDKELRLPDGTRFTENGLYSLAKFTKITPSTAKNLVEQEYPSVLSHLINREMERRAAGQKDGDRTFKLRMRQAVSTDEGCQVGDRICRAVVGQTYGVINNNDAVRAIADAIPSSAHGDVLVAHMWDDGDDVKGSLLLPDYLQTAVSDGYGCGAYFMNSEVGNKMFRLHPYLFRGVCLNGIISGQFASEVKLDVKHNGHIDWIGIRIKVKRAMDVCFAHGQDLLTQLGYTEDIAVPNVTNTVALLARDHKLTRSQAMAWLEGYKIEIGEQAEEKTAFAVVNGLTRGAQKFTGDARERMEMVAGAILSPKLGSTKDATAASWKSACEAASRLSTEDVSKLVYVALR